MCTSGKLQLRSLGPQQHLQEAQANISSNEASIIFRKNNVRHDIQCLFTQIFFEALSVKATSGSGKTCWKAELSLLRYLEQNAAGSYRFIVP